MATTGNCSCLTYQAIRLEAVTENDQLIDVVVVVVIVAVAVVVVVAVVSDDDDAAA